MDSKFIPMQDVEVGMSAGSDIYDTWGRKVLSKHTQLTKRNINMLKRRGFVGVYIDTSRNCLLNKRNIKLYSAIERSADAVSEKLFDESCTEYSKEYKNLRKNIRSLILDELDVKENSFDIENLRRFNEYTCVHSIDVASISVAIGIGMGLTESYLEDLCIAALFHDIGKLAIPKEIIEKPDKLTDEEFSLIKTHPSRGAYLIRTTPLYNTRVFDGIMGHHENWDGTGYPFGLHGNQISLFASIIHVADVYDALTTDRPYRITSSLLDAYDYILKNSGTLFSPKVVEAFSRRIRPLRKGSIVLLNTGDIGVVTQSNSDSPLEPTVHLIERDMILDLSMSGARIERQISL